MDTNIPALRASGTALTCTGCNGFGLQRDAASWYRPGCDAVEFVYTGSWSFEEASSDRVVEGRWWEAWLQWLRPAKRELERGCHFLQEGCLLKDPASYVDCHETEFRRGRVDTTLVTVRTTGGTTGVAHGDDGAGAAGHFSRSLFSAKLSSRPVLPLFSSLRPRARISWMFMWSLSRDTATVSRLADFPRENSSVRFRR